MIPLAERIYMRYVILLIFSLSFMIHAQENTSISTDDSCGRKTTIAVLEFSGNGVYATDICISYQFREVLKKTGRFEVMRRSSMHLVFEEAVYPWFDCNEIECAIIIGRILSVQKVIFGSMKKQDKTLILTTYVINPVTEEIGNTYTEKCTGCSKNDSFLRTIKKLCLQIADHEAGD